MLRYIDFDYRSRSRVRLLLLPNLRGSTGHKEALKTKIRCSARAVMAMAAGQFDSQDVSILQPTRLGRLNMGGSENAEGRTDR